MKIIIDYNGKTYESRQSTTTTVEQMKQAIYSGFDDFMELEVELKDGGYLILGREAVRSCAIIILDK